MAISFQIRMIRRRLAACQASYSSKLRGKIVGAPERGTKFVNKFDEFNIVPDRGNGKTHGEMYVAGAAAAER
jgi:hypothetical protein